MTGKPSRRVRRPSTSKKSSESNEVVIALSRRVDALHTKVGTLEKALAAAIATVHAQSMVLNDIQSAVGSARNEGSVKGAMEELLTMLEYSLEGRDSYTLSGIEDVPKVLDTSRARVTVKVADIVLHAATAVEGGEVELHGTLLDDPYEDVEDADGVYPDADPYYIGLP